MKHFYLRVTARSPLAIRSDHAEGGVKTTQYIPGATLLGSLAASHRILRPEQEDEFAASSSMSRCLSSPLSCSVRREKFSRIAICR